MQNILSNRRFDSALEFARSGYRFVSSECDRLETDLFQTRLFFRKTICMRGPEAAELFYDESRFKRRGVTPGRLVKTLFGKKGVQGLDDAAHRRRIEMFMSLMSEERIDDLAQLMLNQFERQLLEWEQRPVIEVLDATGHVLSHAVCEWCGIDTAQQNMQQVTSDQMSMVDGSGAVGLRHWQARKARRRGNAWARQLIRETRHGLIKPSTDTALWIIATHTDEQGQVLPDDVAAVELQNIIRPTIAIARWIMFAVHAMHTQSDAYADLRSNMYLEAADRFGEEVRRFYPFFPFVAAQTRRRFEWNGYNFPARTRVLLDLYGTTHHPEHWKHADQFDPDRFFHEVDRRYLFIPHGGGDYHQNHRCAGEPITRRLLRDAIRYIADHVDFDVPEQDMTISMTRIPAEPADRMLLTNVRRRANVGSTPVYAAEVTD